MNKLITHTTPNGETISYKIRTIFNICFMVMDVNFDPVTEILFANTYMLSIPGINRLVGVRINKGNTGTYYFSMSQDYDKIIVPKDIQRIFTNYFIYCNKKKLLP